MKKIVVIFGTRPEAIKLAPVIAELRKRPGVALSVVATGQHQELVNPLLDDFGIEPDHRLNLMSSNQGLGDFGGRLLIELSSLLRDEGAEIVVVQGDTGSALFGGIAGFFHGAEVAHVEAGLRTHNLRSPFPEEGNRAMLSRVTRYHFAPTAVSRKNLLDEGIEDGSIYVSGNPVIDALEMEIWRQEGESAETLDTELLGEIGTDWRKKPYVLVTGHRRENMDGGFERICEALKSLTKQFEDYHFIYPVHLNPNVDGVVRRELGGIENIRLISPQDYRPFVRLLSGCYLVLTDSGGIQEEAPALGKPVLVMRDTTERPEGVDAGTVRLVGSSVEKIVESVAELLKNQEVYTRMSQSRNPYGDGRAAERIADVLCGEVSEKGENG